MILAAGRGERLRPLTDRVPKPLLQIGRRRLVEIHLARLQKAGFRRVVVNLAHLGDRIRETLGNGSRYGLEIAYAQEPPGALETGGGIRNALPLFRREAFLVLNGDVLTDFPLESLGRRLEQLAPQVSAHLVLVDNPSHHPGGDFALHGGRVALRGGEGTLLTYSGIGLYRRRLFAGLAPGRFPLAPVLREAIERGEVTGEYYRGAWLDVGTPARLNEARRLATERGL